MSTLKISLLLPILNEPPVIEPLKDASPEESMDTLFPIVIPLEFNKILVVLPSFNRNSLLVIEICSVLVSPIVVVAPNAACVVPAATTSTPSDFTFT